MIICAGDIESFSFAKPIGIGLVNSAINLTSLLLTYCPAKLTFIGSAGSYGKFDIFEIVRSATASNIELSFLEQKSYTPIDNVVSASSSSDTIVNSSNYISTDFDLSNEFNKYGIGIENMEFFSVVNCAKKFNIEVEGIFIVTNYCNQEAHQDFLKNHTKSKELLIKYLIDNKFVSRETLG